MKWTLRTANEEDLDRLVEIWLEESLDAHDFIDPAYWEENKDAMRGLYLPLSENYVAERDGEIAGFVSMMGDYLAALFVDKTYQHQDLGRQMLDFVKEERMIIELKVYAKNRRALHFYGRNGFAVTKKSRDEAAGEEEWVMEWRK